MSFPRFNNPGANLSLSTSSTQLGSGGWYSLFGLAALIGILVAAASIFKRTTSAHDESLENVSEKHPASVSTSGRGSTERLPRSHRFVPPSQKQLSRGGGGAIGPRLSTIEDEDDLTECSDDKSVDEHGR